MVAVFLYGGCTLYSVQYGRFRVVEYWLDGYLLIMMVEVCKAEKCMMT